MPWFLTHYAGAPGARVARPGMDSIGEYGSFVWARTWREAETLCLRRGIGEHVVGRSGRRAAHRPEPRPSDLLRKRRLGPAERLGVVHAVCFLAGIWATSRNLPAWAVTADQAVLHDTIHCLSLGRPTRAEMIERLRVVEAETPGFLTGRER